MWQDQFSSPTTLGRSDESQRPEGLRLGGAPLPHYQTRGLGATGTGRGVSRGRTLPAAGRGLQGGACLLWWGRGGPMSKAARMEAGPARGCGALRGGGRRQKRASRGLLVGAARSWRRDWLRHSRVRRLLGSGRAPRPRARRPLTARYVLARRLRCGARAPRARRRQRRRRQLGAESPGSGGGGGAASCGREEQAPAAARPPALGECAARPLPPSLAAQAPIPVAGRASRGTPAAARGLARGGDTVADVLAGEAAARPGESRPPPLGPSGEGSGRSAAGPGLRAAAMGQASARPALRGTRGLRVGHRRVRPSSRSLGLQRGSSRGPVGRKPEDGALTPRRRRGRAPQPLGPELLRALGSTPPPPIHRHTLELL